MTTTATKKNLGRVDVVLMTDSCPDGCCGSTTATPTRAILDAKGYTITAGREMEAGNKAVLAALAADLKEAGYTGHLHVVADLDFTSQHWSESEADYAARTKAAAATRIRLLGR